MPKLSETRVNQAGIMRCCVSAFEDLDPDQHLVGGEHIKCKHCKSDNSGFILVYRRIVYNTSNSRTEAEGWIWDPAWSVLEERAKEKAEKRKE